MIKPLSTGVGVAVCSLALSLTAGVGGRVRRSRSGFGSPVRDLHLLPVPAALNAQDPQWHSTHRRTCGHSCSSSSPRRRARINASSGRGGGEQSQSNESTGITDYSKGF